MDFLDKKKRETIASFIKFVANELDLDVTPSVCVQNNRKNIKTTAHYDYSKKKKVIRVCGAGRALVDILRSIAHEMVHHKQFERGDLEVKPKDIGGDIEDEANAKAGVFIKLYGRKDGSIYDL